MLTLSLEIPVKADQAFAVLQGLEQFRKHAGAAEIEHLEIETQTADGTDAPGCDYSVAEKSLGTPK